MRLDVYASRPPVLGSTAVLHHISVDDEDLGLLREAIHLLHVAECERFNCAIGRRQLHDLLVSGHIKERRDRSWHLREYLDSLMDATE